MNQEIKRVAPAEAFALLSALKAEGYNVLVDLTALDYSAHPAPPLSSRFDLVYRLASLDPGTGLETKPRVEVHCGVGTEPAVPSAASLWPAADWLEREIWDMFGVRFTDRPDMKRLLLYEEFIGHPLRKDYPIARRQPLIGPASGEREGSPSFNIVHPTIKYE
jgi:NADH-quinone oxidoreductase subunit C